MNQPLDKKLYAFIGTYMIGIFYATYQSIKYPIDIRKIKWS